MVITVTGVVVRDADGRLLTVRKRGTHRFMLPGGKPEPGETAAQTGVRECAEEIGLHIDLDELRLLGHFDAPAANEAGFRVDSTVFVYEPADGAAPPDVTALTATGEIEAVRWMDPLDDAEDLAPLLRSFVLPTLRGRGPRTATVPTQAG